MPQTSPDALTRALDRGPRGGVFFLHGDEEFLKERAAQTIIAAHVARSTRDFNLDQVRGATVTPETFASLCQTPPMLADWRVVVVREAQALATSAPLRTAVEDVLARPVPGLALVLIARLPDRSKAKFYQQLTRDAVSVEFRSIPSGDVPDWLIARAEQQGIDLEPAAARALAAAAGTDLGVLVQELEKLAGYIGDRARIRQEDVAAVVGPVPKQNRWDWIDTVGDRRFGPARETLAVLLGSGETGVGLVIAIGTHLLRLAIAATGGETALGQALPPHQRWLAKRITQQARRWNARELDAALDDLLRADRLLKTTSLYDLQVMEELLLRLENRVEHTAAAESPRNALAR